MAVTCASSVLVPASACYTVQTLNPRQQKAFLIFAKMFVLKNAGGTDYTSSISTTLVSDAVQMICGATSDQIVAANIAMHMEAGSITSVLALGTKMAATSCISNLDELTLEKMNVFLNCKILAAFGL